MKKYEDIIGLSRPVSKKHPPMSRENRAAQFAPFAALTGFEGAIKETARVTGEKIELDETQKTFLDENQGTTVLVNPCPLYVFSKR